LTKPMMGFGSFHTARRTLSGIEAMSMIRKGQVKGISRGDSVAQAKFIEDLFGVSAQWNANERLRLSLKSICDTTFSLDYGKHSTIAPASS